MSTTEENNSEYSSSFDIPEPLESENVKHEVDGGDNNHDNNEIEGEHHTRFVRDGHRGRGRGGFRGGRGRLHRGEAPPGWITVAPEDSKATLTEFTEKHFRERKRREAVAWVDNIVAKEEERIDDSIKLFEFPESFIQYSLEELCMIGGVQLPVVTASLPVVKDNESVEAEKASKTNETQSIEKTTNANPLPDMPADLILVSESPVGDPEVKADSGEEAPKEKTADTVGKTDADADKKKETEKALEGKSEKTDTKPLKVKGKQTTAEKEGGACTEETLPDIPAETVLEVSQEQTNSQFFSQTEYPTLPASKTKKQAKSASVTAVFDFGGSEPEPAPAPRKSPSKKAKINEQPEKKKKAPEEQKPQQQEKEEAHPAPKPTGSKWGVVEKKTESLDSIMTEQKEEKKKKKNGIEQSKPVTVEETQETKKPKEQPKVTLPVEKPKSVPKKKLESLETIMTEQKEEKKNDTEQNKSFTVEETEAKKPKEQTNTRPVRSWGVVEKKKAPGLDAIMAEQTEEKKKSDTEQSKIRAAEEARRREKEERERNPWGLPQTQERIPFLRSAHSVESEPEVMTQKEQAKPSQWGAAGKKKTESLDSIMSEQKEDKKKSDKEKNKVRAAEEAKRKEKEERERNPWGLKPNQQRTAQPIETQVKQAKEQPKPAPKPVSQWGVVERKKAPGLDAIMAEQREEKKKRDDEKSTARAVEEAMRKEKEERQKNAWGVSKGAEAQPFSDILTEQKTQRIVMEEEALAHKAQQESEWEPLPPVKTAAVVDSHPKKSKAKAKPKVVEEETELFWGEAPASEKSEAPAPTEYPEDLFWGNPEEAEEVVEEPKKRSKNKKPAANAWTDAPKLAPESAASPSKGKTKPKKQVASAWGTVPKSSAKSMDEIMFEEQVASEARRREEEQLRLEQNEAEKISKNAWGIVPTPSGSSSLSMTEENFPSLGGSSNSISRSAPKRTQAGNGGLNYSGAMGQIAPTISRLDESFPALGAPAARKGKR